MPLQRGMNKRRTWEGRQRSSHAAMAVKMSWQPRQMELHAESKPLLLSYKSLSPVAKHHPPGGAKRAATRDLLGLFPPYLSLGRDDLATTTRNERTNEDINK